MTDRTDDPPVADGPTRDITTVDAPTTAVRGPLPPPGGPVRSAPEAPDPAAAEARRAAGRRTDEIARSPGPERERTLAFSAPEMRHRPIEPVQVGSNPRRWPWVVLALLPVLVIVGSGIAWLILLDGM